MEVRATIKNTRSGPRKLRAVLALVKGKTVGEALPILQHHARRGAAILYKLVHAAAANAAVLDKKVDSDALLVRGGWVNQGPTMKRYRPMSMGRAGHIRKRTSSVTVVLGDGKKATAKAATRAKAPAAK
ncbi:MAG TPA: 50S ribosomal protein L22, partial [bacterium]|nr:50S ribosomal protein L22 [bacterium]